MVSSCKRSPTGRSPTAPGVKAERDALQTTVSSQAGEPASARETLGSMTDYEDWKTLAASSKRNNRGESIGHESASPRPDSGGTVLYAICRACLPKLITGMLMIGIRAFRHSSGLYTVGPLTIRCFWSAGGPTVDNQSCCRKASTLSVGLNLSEVASVGASFSRARSFVARSASM